MLQWSDKESSQKASTSLGASLNSGHCLHIDLQKAYICDDECEKISSSNMEELKGETQKTVMNIDNKCNENDHYYYSLEKSDITD